MKRKPGVSMTVEQRINRITIIHEIEKNNRLKRAGKNLQKMGHVVIKTIDVASGFPVEFHVDNINVVEIQSMCKDLAIVGFKPQVYTKSDGKDFENKLGTVKSVTKKADKNQWEVVITIDGEGSGEAKVVAFAATAFRKGDRVRLSKNDKGYLQATLLSGEEEEEPTNDKLAF